MDRTAHELGCVAMTFNFRGCGNSEGDFSLQGWVDDLRNAISHVLTLHEPTGVILLGTNTGGSIAICVAADDPRGVGSRPAESRLPISTTGPNIPAASSSTPATLA